MNFRLKTKYSLAIVSLIVAIIVVLAGTLFYQFALSQRSLVETSRQTMEHNLQSQMKKRCESVLRLLADSLVNPLYSYDMQKVFELLNAALRQNGVLSAIVYDSEGKIIHDGKESVPSFGDSIDDEASITAVNQEHKFVVQIQDHILYGSLPIWIGDLPLGGVKIGMSLEGIYQDMDKMSSYFSEIRQDGLRRNIVTAILTSIIFIILGILLSIFLATRFTTPIKEVIEHTNQIGRGEYDFQLSSRHNDELGDLIRSFNQMGKDLKHNQEALRRSHDELKQEIKERKKKEEERRQLELQLYQTQKMEAIGTLTGGIAHDFNNLLGSILGFSFLGLEEADPNSDLHNYLMTINEVGERAQKLVQQMLTFSRAKEPQLKTLYVKPVIDESIHMLRPVIPSTIEMISKTEADCQPILGDETQLQQVVVNLCTNAYQAMEKSGGKLTITLKEVRIEKQTEPLNQLQPGVYSHLTVEDTGMGMTAETIDSIFDPFFSTKEPGKGTGLGLSVVHGIIQSHHGVITCESEPGKGTTFHVYLPVSDGEVAVEQRGQEKIVPGKEHILLVDDEVSFTKFLSIALKNQGYHVSVYNDAQLALDQFKKQSEQYDLILTDLTMPKMTGIQFSQAISAIRSDIPIILATGNDSTKSVYNAESSGINHVIEKPFKLDHLSSMIRAAVKR